MDATAKIPLFDHVIGDPDRRWRTTHWAGAPTRPPLAQASLFASGPALLRSDVEIAMPQVRAKRPLFGVTVMRELMRRVGIAVLVAASGGLIGTADAGSDLPRAGK